ncbi:putative serine/threonine-protein kinase-like protein CCR3 [Cajanus cajan]|uniref:putative serine/threonine-protein kinase-like protein CCR3 n=1 Tax=Cajanus cajan TaxID=3821 RepID=UPI00098D997D|nr:putative serine/threonine-protein kinase-like protein CCR3 [Cajanus cajan]
MTNQMDNDEFESFEMRFDAIISYSWRVDSMIRSETASNLGESPLPSFDSRVDRAIRSRTPSSMSNFESSPLHTIPRLFTLRELKEATNNFSVENKIGVGSFGDVYRGKLFDGGDVAIKSDGFWSKIEGLNNSELASWSRLPPHKHLVGVVGLCQENGERFLVYEYMKNLSLYDQLHDKYRSVLNSWKMRIKIALDASRGIQHVQNYAVPHAHRGVMKSSNILLDGSWTVKVSDFRMTFMKNTTGCDECIDPEYDGVNALTKKRDVYGFGVVLLELLTGKRPILDSHGETLLRMVGGGKPNILLRDLKMFSAKDLMKNLDSKVGPPDVNEARALMLMADTAIPCVTVTQETLTMDAIVENLEQALAMCMIAPPLD